MYTSYSKYFNENAATPWHHIALACRKAIMWSFVVTVAVAAPLAIGEVSVLTQHNDVLRTGQNVSETLLTPSNVNSEQFGKLFTQPVDGMIVGQPLVVPGLSFPDGTHDAVYVTTQHDSVFAFDANNNTGSNASPLWSVSFINPGAGITSVPVKNYDGCPATGFTEIGVTSTPVIDPVSGTIYVLAKTLENGQTIYRLHALDLITGQEKLGGPVELGGAVSGITFNPLTELQRPALLLSNGVIYVAFGGNGCDSFLYYGWLFAVNVSGQTMTQSAVFLTTPNKREGGIWQGGGGPAADAEGNVYFATANGLFDGDLGGPDWGDTVLKMQLGGSGFGVVDYFTPSNQYTLGTTNKDLGSGGVTLFPNQNQAPVYEMIAGGKLGTLFLINRDSMGEFNSVSDNIVQEVPNATAGEIDSVESYWNNNVYVVGLGDYVKVFSLTNSMLSSSPASESAMTLFQPWSTSVSANGTTNGILWAVNAIPPVFYAFDATNLATTLYTSNENAKRDKPGQVSLTHFSAPTIANGKVYLSGNGQLFAYGLLPALTPVAGNNQSGAEGTTLPTALQISANDSYSGAALAGVSITCSVKNGGTINPATLTTNSSGLTPLAKFTLPKKAATSTITCSSSGFAPAVFTETSVP